MNWTGLDKLVMNEHDTTRHRAIRARHSGVGCLTTLFGGVCTILLDWDMYRDGINETGVRTVAYTKYHGSTKASVHQLKRI